MALLCENLDLRFQLAFSDFINLRTIPADQGVVLDQIGSNNPLTTAIKFDCIKCPLRGQVSLGNKYDMHEGFQRALPEIEELVAQYCQQRKQPNL